MQGRHGHGPQLADALDITVPKYCHEHLPQDQHPLMADELPRLARISHKLQAKSNWCRNVIVLPANLPAADRVAA